MNRHTKILLCIASLFAAGSIILASFGAHGAGGILIESNLINAFDKAVDYGLFNAVALIGIAIVCQIFSDEKFYLPGYCIALGGIIFQTSLFLYTLAGLNWITNITPIGGILMITGWLYLMILSIRSPD